MTSALKEQIDSFGVCAGLARLNYEELQAAEAPKKHVYVDAYALALGHRTAIRAEIDKLEAAAKVSTEKWQVYEAEYILPVFDEAKKIGYDLPRAIVDNPGKNCVGLFVEHLLRERSLLIEGRGIQDEEVRTSKATAARCVDENEQYVRMWLTSNKDLDTVMRACLNMQRELKVLWPLAEAARKLDGVMNGCDCCSPPDIGPECDELFKRLGAVYSEMAPDAHVPCAACAHKKLLHTNMSPAPPHVRSLAKISSTACSDVNCQCPEFKPEPEES